jgi:hypothetical protein
VDPFVKSDMHWQVFSKNIIHHASLKEDKFHEDLLIKKLADERVHLETKLNYIDRARTVGVDVLKHGADSKFRTIVDSHQHKIEKYLMETA